MDFSLFGAEQWEVKSWVNEAFQDVQREKRDSHAASLLTKLQLVAQDISKELDLKYKIFFLLKRWSSLKSKNWGSL